MELHVTVVSKKATYLKRFGDIVCGNSDYTITFTFDSDWDGATDKVARFVWNGMYYDSPIVDDVCTVPIIQNATEVKVGVYAGELKTTTSAVIPCVPSILCGNAQSAPENDANYAGEARQSAERAEKAAEEAANAAQVATEAAGDEVARLVGELGVVQSMGDSKTAVMSQKAVTSRIEELDGRVWLHSSDFVNGYFSYGTGLVESNYWISTLNGTPISKGDKITIKPNGRGVTFLYRSVPSLDGNVPNLGGNSNITEETEIISAYDGYAFFQVNHGKGNYIRPADYDCEIAFGESKQDALAARIAALEARVAELEAANGGYTATIYTTSKSFMWKLNDDEWEGSADVGIKVTKADGSVIYLSEFEFSEEPDPDKSLTYGEELYSATVENAVSVEFRGEGYIPEVQLYNAEMDGFVQCDENPYTFTQDGEHIAVYFS